MLLYISVGNSFALERDGIDLVRSDVYVCRENGYDRFDIRLSLKNVTSKKISFGAYTSGAGGLKVLPMYINGEFCYVGNGCVESENPFEHYDAYTLNVEVRPKGIFLYTDSILVKPKSMSENLNGLLVVNLRIKSSLNDDVFFRIEQLEKKINMDTVDRCDKFTKPGSPVG